MTPVAVLGMAQIMRQTCYAATASKLTCQVRVHMLVKLCWVGHCANAGHDLGVPQHGGLKLNHTCAQGVTDDAQCVSKTQLMTKASTITKS